MKIGHTDISRDAIRTGLARQMLEHYASSEGRLHAERMPVVDDCYFRLTVLLNEVTDAIERILLTATQMSRKKKGFEVEDGHVTIESGTEFCVTSHIIDLQKNIAMIPDSEAENFALEPEQVGILRNGIKRATAAAKH